mmetsp:Transcript_10386/g.19683  ORF Transcript_10386/g.19683 Transcript_10386/m.19683 type:complete len:708 (-) Transcript_10386:436-2559(-)
MSEALPTRTHTAVTSESKQPAERITVAVRCRPLTGDAIDVVRLRPNNQLSVECKGKEKTTYQVDKTYDGRSTNDQIYQDLIAPKVRRTFDGFNACALFYGISGSGKAHCLHGDGNPKNKGVLQSAVEDLFSMIDKSKSLRSAQVSLAMFEIRRDTVVDLITPRTLTGLPLRTWSDLNLHNALGLYMEQLSDSVCDSAAQILKLVDQGLRVRDTLLSRNKTGKPHTVIDIKLSTANSFNPEATTDNRRYRVSWLRFVHVAGSGGASLHFNKGLQSLGLCVRRKATREKSWSVPFSGSKLTRILEPCLGGNCTTVWLAFIAGHEKSYKDTCNTLELAQLARKVSGEVGKNYLCVSELLEACRKQLSVACKHMQLHNPDSFLHSLDQGLVDRYDNLVRELEHTKRQDWGTKKLLSVRVAEEREEVLKQQGLLTCTADPAHSSAELLKQNTDLRAGMVEQLRNLDACRVEAQAARRQLRDVLVAKHKRLPKAEKGPIAIGSDPKLASLHQRAARCEEAESEQEARVNVLTSRYVKSVGKIIQNEATQKKEDLLHRRYQVADTTSTARLQLRSNDNYYNDLAVLEADFDVNMAKLDRKVANQDKKQLGQEIRDQITEQKEQQKRLAALRWERDHLLAKLEERSARHEVQAELAQKQMFLLFRTYRSHFESERKRADKRLREVIGQAADGALSNFQKSTESTARWENINSALV